MALAGRNAEQKHHPIQTLRVPSELEPYLPFYLVYASQSDAPHLFNWDLLSCAMEFEPLLYAILGNVAFRLESIPDSFAFHIKSVNLLQGWLDGIGSCTDVVILTILQLAAFEVHDRFLLLISQQQLMSHILGGSWKS